MAKPNETDEDRKAREVVEEIAITIAKLSRQVNAILDGRLKRKSLVILLAHSASLPQRTVEQVLEALQNLEANHLK
jgi:hypothetical protein